MKRSMRYGSLKERGIKREPDEEQIPRGEMLMQESSRPELPADEEVLIVEDQADLRETLADLLVLEGYRVATATNGQEALDHLRSHVPPQVILLDLRMPVMNGWTFLQEQQQSPALAPIPVVVISGEAQVADKAAALGAADHLTKPVDLTALFQLLERYCR
jgi:CheY-like chemotaxis protein